MSLRIFVAGASGRVGSRLFRSLASRGDEVIAGSRANGVDTASGAGIAAAIRGSEILVDVTNAISRDPDEVKRFFVDSSTNLVAAAREAGVRHCVLLSVVGADRMPDGGYMRAKVAQEQIVAKSGLPYTIVRATQFDEFVATFGDVFAAEGGVVVPDALVQPIAIDDVVRGLVKVIDGPPVNGIVNLAGPRAMPMTEAVALALRARGDSRRVIASRDVRYFGALLERDTLVP